MSEKTGKGRPSKKASYSIIRDPMIEPYYIQKDATNFTVIKTTTPTRGFAGKAPKRKTIDKEVGHYSSFGNALNRIAREKFYKKSGEFQTIQEYINNWESLRDGIRTLINEIEI